MSMNDPIADMLSRIKTAQAVNKAKITMPASKAKRAVAEVLKAEGYIRDFHVNDQDAHATLGIELKYVEGRGAIEVIRRVSKPGKRQYFGKGALPKVNHGLGIAVVSTSQGVMTDRQAREQGHGGELLCIVA